MQPAVVLLAGANTPEDALFRLHRFPLRAIKIMPSEENHGTQYGDINSRYNRK